MAGDGGVKNRRGLLVLAVYFVGKLDLMSLHPHI
nr:MAG TPA: hypothetical protein [Caudoviricetes sp.]